MDTHLPWPEQPLGHDAAQQGRDGASEGRAGWSVAWRGRLQPSVASALVLSRPAGPRNAGPASLGKPRGGRPWQWELTSSPRTGKQRLGGVGATRSEAVPTQRMARACRPCNSAAPRGGPEISQRWHASPSNPAKHLQRPVPRSQMPALEHSALLWAVVAPVGMSTQALSAGHTPAGRPRKAARSAQRRLEASKPARGGPVRQWARPLRLRPRPLGRRAAAAVRGLTPPLRGQIVPGPSPPCTARPWARACESSRCEQSGALYTARSDSEPKPSKQRQTRFVSSHVPWLLQLFRCAQALASLPRASSSAHSAAATPRIPGARQAVWGSPHRAAKRLAEPAGPARADARGAAPQARVTPLPRPWRAAARIR